MVHIMYGSYYMDYIICDAELYFYLGQLRQLGC